MYLDGVICKHFEINGDKKDMLSHNVSFLWLFILDVAYFIVLQFKIDISALY
jgi:hypothetical protein